MRKQEKGNALEREPVGFTSEGALIMSYGDSLFALTLSQDSNGRPLCRGPDQYYPTSPGYYESTHELWFHLDFR